MFARILKSGTFHDVVGYVMREFFSPSLEQLKGHDKNEYTPDTWRITDCENILTLDYKRIMQSFEVTHGFSPGKKNPAGHISINFDNTDAPRQTDDFMMQLAKEYMDGMGIKNTLYLVVRHLETEHPHFHIVYNRIDMDGKAINERYNYKRSDKVVKALKDKYGLTYSPLKKKYEEQIPEFHKKISQAMYGCKSWDEFQVQLACAGIDVKFHTDRNTGERIGVKFTDGDKTLNGSKIDRHSTYRPLNNFFESNRKQTQGYSSSTPFQPNVTVSHATQQPSSLIENVVEAAIDATYNLFQVGPGFDPEEEAFARNMRKKMKKKTQTQILKWQIFTIPSRNKESRLTSCKRT